MSFGGALHGRVAAKSRIRRRMMETQSSSSSTSAPSVSSVQSGTSSPTTYYNNSSAVRHESIASSSTATTIQNRTYGLPSFVQVGVTDVEEPTWGQFVDTAEADNEIVRSSKILSAREKSFEEELYN